MKRFLALLLAAVMGLSACAARGGEEKGDAVFPVMPVEAAPVSQTIPEDLPDPEAVCQVAEGVSFSLLQDAFPVGTDRMTLVIDNQSGQEIGWGTWEVYEKFVDGQWQRLEYVEDVLFEDVMWILEPEGVRTQQLRALGMLPELDEGLYRLTGSSVWVGEEKCGPWQVSFRIDADAQAEPEYALYISSQPIPTVEGCLVTDRIPAFFINTTGKDAEVLLIPHLERLDGNGEWAEVPFKDGIGFCGTPDPLPPEGKAWYWEVSMLWGDLEDGRYRVGVQCQPYLDTEETVYGEFALFTPEDTAGLPLAGQE